MGLKKVITFGEIMMRLSTPGFQRFAQARGFDAIYAGAEANVAIALSNLGVPADYITRLPDNDLGDSCINFLRQFGVGTGKIIRGGDRLGIYFVEMGASQRGNKVIYDRANSSFATIDPSMIDWNDVLEDACWFHWTGISPAVSKEAADACMAAVVAAKEKGIPVSCDINYRGKLWKWGQSASDVMAGLMPHVDVLVGNEEDAEKVFGIKAAGVDVEAGAVDASAFEDVAKNIMAMFPGLKVVAFTLRGSINATHNTWSAILYDGEKSYTAPIYDITDIVDRVGAGDSFSAGLIYGMLKFDDEERLQKTLDFATAISCLKHTIPGDSVIVKIEEIEDLMKGKTSGRISR
ncbi:MAG TPA: sugar kinase [Candidatus Lokiarchaeia archaeon]|nr:sugar kinase [Candidatus Lokiarchaeia archaeon]